MRRSPFAVLAFLFLAGFARADDQRHVIRLSDEGGPPRMLSDRPLRAVTARLAGCADEELGDAEGALAFTLRIAPNGDVSSVRGRPRGLSGAATSCLLGVLQHLTLDPPGAASELITGFLLFAPGTPTATTPAPPTTTPRVSLEDADQPIFAWPTLVLHAVPEAPAIEPVVAAEGAFRECASHMDADDQVIFTLKLSFVLRVNDAPLVESARASVPAGAEVATCTTKAIEKLALRAPRGRALRVVATFENGGGARLVR